MIVGLILSIIIISLIVWSIIRNIDYKVDFVTFEYYINNGRDPINMPGTFLSNWKYNILENHRYLLNLSLESLDDTLFDTVFDYLRYVWMGYNGREIYIDVYDKGEVVGRYKVNNGKVYLRRKEAL